MRNRSATCAAFSVDRGVEHEGTTRMCVTYYHVLGIDGAVPPLESFIVERSRSDS